MKKFLLWVLACATGITSFTQQAVSENTLLWRISGKNLSKPSYLFGTIHLLCDNDLGLSDSLKAAIRTSDKVYLELDMDNLFEMMQAMQKMKMRNDTTLSDLMSASDYEKVKGFFSTRKSIIPFAVLETYKPMLAASMIMQTSFECENTISMEQLIMKQAKQVGRDIKGLETMAYQLSIFDSIPYSVQAKQLINFINDNGTDKKASKDYEEMAAAYRSQQLDKLEKLINKEEFGIDNFADLLLYNRNTNWVKKMDQIFSNGSAVIAVGAGHLPGEKGVIQLLRKAGYKVEPVPNIMLPMNQKVI